MPVSPGCKRVTVDLPIALIERVSDLAAQPPAIPMTEWIRRVIAYHAGYDLPSRTDRTRANVRLDGMPKINPYADKTLDRVLERIGEEPRSAADDEEQLPTSEQPTPAPPPIPPPAPPSLGLRQVAQSAEQPGSRPYDFGAALARTLGAADPLDPMRDEMERTARERGNERA